MLCVLSQRFCFQFLFFYRSDCKLPLTGLWTIVGQEEVKKCGEAIISNVYDTVVIPARTVTRILIWITDGSSGNTDLGSTRNVVAAE